MFLVIPNNLELSVADLAMDGARIISFNELLNGKSLKLNAVLDRAPNILPEYAHYRCHISFRGYTAFGFVLRLCESKVEENNLHCSFAEPVQSLVVLLAGSVHENQKFVESEAMRRTKIVEEKYQSKPILHLGDITPLVTS